MGGKHQLVANVDQVAVFERVGAADDRPVLGCAISALGDGAQGVAGHDCVRRGAVFHQRDRVHHGVAGHHVVLVRHHLILLAHHLVIVSHHDYIDGDFQQGGDFGIGEIVIHDMNGRHPVSWTGVGAGLARRLVGSGARLLIGLRTRVPQEQVRGHVVHHHVHRHPVHVEKGDAHLVRSDEKVVGLHKHRGEGQVRCVRRSFYFELVSPPRRQHSRCIRARGSIEYARMKLHVAQGSCQLGRISVFGQRLKPVSAISFTGCE